MADGFLEAWGRQLFTWFAFVFTVVGTIVALGLAREYWWISVLVVLAVFAASASFAFWKHRELEQERHRHREEVKRFSDEHQQMTRRLQDSERKLNDVPYEILINLQRVIAGHSFAEATRILAEYADLIGRMTRFAAALSRPINLRAFVRQAGDLYAIAKVASQALEHVRVGDPFLLVKRSTGGLETHSARLIVHQAPDLAKEIAMFRIGDYLSDEMGHIDKLAQSSDIEGMKGYTIRVACDLSQYEGVDVQGMAKALSQLVQDVARNRGV